MLGRFSKISLIIIIMLFVSCSSISYVSLYKNAQTSLTKNIVLSLLYQVPSERIKQIIDSDNSQILQQKEIERISARQSIHPNMFKKNQLQRIQYANTLYSEQLKKGMFTDRGRIYIKYGEPTAILDMNDKTLGKTQKWNYSELNKTFVFLYNEDHYTYKLYNVQDEDYFE